MATDAGNGLATPSAIDSDLVAAAWSAVSRSDAHTLDAQRIFLREQLCELADTIGRDSSAVRRGNPRRS
jgi:hypothetical protein